MLSSLGIVLGAVLLAVIVLALYTVTRLIIIVPPNHAAVITGRRRALAGGDEVGYRTVIGGRTIRIPLIEQVGYLSLSTIPIEVKVEDAYSKGNVPLAVQAVANIKIASQPESVFNNAVERLLGKTIGEIEALAKETLTGNLRGVLAKLTPEEVNEDRLGFAKHLSEEADHDLKQLGLQLDVLKIQHVSDKVGYLQAIGEKATAEAIKSAEIAKAEAEAATRQRQAEAHRLSAVAQAENEAETKQKQAAARRLAEIAAAEADAEIKRTQAEAKRLAEVAEAEANMAIAEAQNRLRVRQAELDREAETTEKVARVAASQAEVEAQRELETRRVELQKRRLQADVVEPAEAQRIAAEARAKAEAAPILEAGRAQAEVERQKGLAQADVIRSTGDAQAEVVRLLNEQIQKAGEQGLQVFMAEKLPVLLNIMAEAMRGVEVGRLTVVDGGAGKGLANAAGQKVNASFAMLEQAAGALGLDLDVLVQGLTRKYVVAGEGDGVKVEPLKKPAPAE